MDNRKYIGMDVHKEAIAIAVLNAAGKLVMESIIETKANTILEFLKRAGCQDDVRSSERYFPWHSFYRM